MLKEVLATHIQVLDKKKITRSNFQSNLKKKENSDLC